MTEVAWINLTMIIGDVLWPLFWIALLVAAVLLFRAEKRIHHGILIAGTGLIALQSILASIIWMPIVGLDADNESFDEWWDQTPEFDLIYSGVEWIGLGMIAYGILAHAWTRLKVSRAEAN